MPCCDALCSHQCIATPASLRGLEPDCLREGVGALVGVAARPPQLGGAVCGRTGQQVLRAHKLDICSSVGGKAGSEGRVWRADRCAWGAARSAPQAPWALLHACSHRAPSWNDPPERPPPARQTGRTAAGVARARGARSDVRTCVPGVTSGNVCAGLNVWKCKAPGSLPSRPGQLQVRTQVARTTARPFAGGSLRQSQSCAAFGHNGQCQA